MYRAPLQLAQSLHQKVGVSDEIRGAKNGQQTHRLLACRHCVLGRADLGTGAIAVNLAADRPAPPSTGATTQRANTTIVGCVFQEKDVPGRSPNIAEKAGILEDYILVEIKQAPPASTPGAAGTSGTAQFGSMYKLELADDSKLKAVVGKRVEVTGQIDREAGDSTARPADTPAPSQADKVIGKAASISRSSKSCRLKKCQARARPVRKRPDLKQPDDTANRVTRRVIARLLKTTLIT